MMNVTILKTQDGEWAALYIDGKDVCQGHSIRAQDLALALNALGFEFSFIVRQTTDAQEEVAQRCGRLPDRLP